MCFPSGRSCPQEYFDKLRYCISGTGSKAIAAADGTIAAIKDGIPEMKCL
jgi:hypothetical protein